MTTNSSFLLPNQMYQPSNACSIQKIINKTIFQFLIIIHNINLWIFIIWITENSDHIYFCYEKNKIHAVVSIFLRIMFGAWLNGESRVLRGDSVCSHTDNSRLSQRVSSMMKMMAVGFVTLFQFSWLYKMLLLCHTVFNMGNTLNTLCSPI